MGFGNMLAPIVNVLVENVLSFSASFVLLCKETTLLEENVSITVVPVLVRTFKIYLTSTCPRNKVGSIIESDQMPKMGRKVSPFLTSCIGCKHV